MLGVFFFGTCTWEVVPYVIQTITLQLLLNETEQMTELPIKERGTLKVWSQRNQGQNAFYFIHHFGKQ